MRKDLVKMKIYARRSIYLEEMSVRSPKACDLDLKRIEQAVTHQPVPCQKGKFSVLDLAAFEAEYGTDVSLWIHCEEPISIIQFRV
ncbi:hypothetical protein MKW92_020394 [Papaver armeniacum]|nr:hypothetical protein MKW92_020394 [Papaver armeniacum]